MTGRRLSCPFLFWFPASRLTFADKCKKACHGIDVLMLQILAGGGSKMFQPRTHKEKPDLGDVRQVCCCVATDSSEKVHRCLSMFHDSFRQRSAPLSARTAHSVASRRWHFSIPLPMALRIHAHTAIHAKRLPNLFPKQIVRSCNTLHDNKSISK